jgi:hypothetical protein
MINNNLKISVGLRILIILMPYLFIFQVQVLVGAQPVHFDDD